MILRKRFFVGLYKMGVLEIEQEVEVVNDHTAVATAKTLKNVSEMMANDNGNVRLIKFMKTISKFST